MKKTHILVVEDEEFMRKSLNVILKSAGYQVSMVANGLEALEFICDHVDEHDVIGVLLFDIQMPKMTGIRMLEELNNLKIHFPLLAMTGYRDKKMIMALRDRGCQRFIEKPFKREELIEKLKDALLAA